MEKWVELSIILRQVIRTSLGSQAEIVGAGVSGGDKRWSQTNCPQRKRNAPWTACDLSPPSLKRLVAPSLARKHGSRCHGSFATSRGGDGWNKFQHSTALCATRRGLRATCRRRHSSDLSRRASLASTGAVATALCVTSPAGHGWNKFQHSTALRATRRGVRATCRRRHSSPGRPGSRRARSQAGSRRHGSLRDKSRRPSRRVGRTSSSTPRRSARSAVDCGSLLPLSSASLLAVSRTDALHQFDAKRFALTKTFLRRDAQRLIASRLAEKSYSRL